MSKNVQAYNALKKLVADHKLSPGQKLLYRDLEEELGMSKTPIINGLIRLEQEGFVVSKKNRGFFIKNFSAEEAEQIYDLREKLEEIAVDFAIKNYSNKDLKILEDKLNLYNDYSAPIYDRKRWELDTDFHVQIATMGKNDLFTSMVKQFYENIYFSLNVVYLTSYVDNFRDEHKRIYDAIRQRKQKEAKKVLKLHFLAARKLFITALES